jgi:hypothetical protein
LAFFAFLAVPLALLGLSQSPQDFLVVVADQFVGVLVVEGFPVQPDLNSAFLGDAHNAVVIDVVSGELAILVENIIGYQMSNIFEIN